MVIIDVVIDVLNGGNDVQIEVFLNLFQGSDLRIQLVLDVGVVNFILRASIIGLVELSLENRDQSLEVTDDGNQLAESVGNSGKTISVLLDGIFVLGDELTKSLDLSVEVINSVVVSDDVLSFLVKEFFEKLVNKRHNLGELILIDFLVGSSEFSQHGKDGGNNRRRLGDEVLLEESNGVSELSLNLDERRGAGADGIEEAQSLLGSSNSFSVVFNSLIVSFIFVFKSLLSSSLVGLVGGEVILFMSKSGFLSNLFTFEIRVFFFEASKIFFSLIEVSGDSGNLVVAPTSLGSNSSIISSFLIIKRFSDVIKNGADGIQTASVF